MFKTIRSLAALVVVCCLAGAMSFAETGEAIYKTKCTNCHGVAGMADTSMARALKVKPITDPEVKKMTLTQMVEAVRNGMGKIQPYKSSLSDAEIKGSVEHFRAFLK
jgi:mono/diheme cytochrome c family protein